MRAAELLRQLDQRLLPPIARAVARLGEGQVRLRGLTTIALLSSVAVVVTAVWANDRRPTGDPTVGDVARVGVGEGQSIPGYVRSAEGELAALATATPQASGRQTYALVSLAAYLAPDRLAGVLKDVSVAEVFGRVPLPGRQTQIVRIPAQRIPQDVLAGMDEVASRKDQEAEDYRARGAAVTGGTAQDRELRQVYTSGAEVAAAEAAAYRHHCTCLYAAVVHAAPETLRTVAGRPGVRVVDPAPEVSRLDRAVFSPPLPEQIDVARPPVDTDLPAADTALPSTGTDLPSTGGGPTGSESTTPGPETPSDPPPASTDQGSGPPDAPTPASTSGASNPVVSPEASLTDDHRTEPGVVATTGTGQTAASLDTPVVFG